ncbi:MAG: CapA family protein [candidate division WOR-3 bacterium]|nr:MAG: CapA family protein [candidate division WOR-3 bacterium]
MKKISPAVVMLIMTIISGQGTGSSYPNIRYDIIEDFDDGNVELLSYPGQDSQPDAWELDSVITYDGSPYSLKLYGNTWKLEMIDPIILDTGDVWQVAAYIEHLGEIQGFGVGDTAHTLLYSFAGTQEVNIDYWVTVYQGAFPNYTWNIYQLPVGEDWLAWYGYLPEVTGIVFVNDRDVDPEAVVYFDHIIDITSDLPIAPQVEIEYTIGDVYENMTGERFVDVQFYSTVIDPDSWYHEYYWYFGDDSTSNEQHPFHTYTVLDDHEYTVLLEVVDSTGLWGRAICHIAVDPGPTTYPITMNFVGDVMLARRYEQPGGIIPTLGVNAIFEPTLQYLGETADITVANLESPLTDTGTPHPTKPIIFRSSPENVAGLVYAGIDVVSLANNHIIDFGLEGLQQTQSVLTDSGILYSGAGAHSYEAYLPLFRVKDGMNIAFCAACNRTGQYDNYQPYLNAGLNKPGFAYLTEHDISRQIQAVEDYADIIICEMHAGNEYSVTPPGTALFDDHNEDEFYSPFFLRPQWDDIALRHHAIDEGADLVVCHHPHLLQGFEVYNGNLIAHSLGDFAFDLNYPETYPSAILNGKIDQRGFYEYRVTPVYIDDYIPRPARGELGMYILNYLARRSKELDTYMIVDPDSINARIILDTLTMSSETFTCTDTIPIYEDTACWTCPPHHLQDAGSISSLVVITPPGTWQYRLGREMTWLWFGNFEDEGSTMWLLDDIDEFYDDSVAFSGLRSLCQYRPTGSGAIVTNLEGRIVCYNDTGQYTLYACIKTDNARDADVRVRFYTARYGSFSIGTSYLGAEVGGTTDWTFYHNDFIPEEGTNFIDVWLRSESPTGGDDGYSWFDNVGIIEWEDWQPFFGQVFFPTPNDYYWVQVRNNAPTDTAVLVYEKTTFSPLAVNEYPTGCEPTSFLLHAFPNPARSQTAIQYSLSHPAYVVLKMYNILGQEVSTLVNEMQPPGQKTITWDGQDNRGRTLGAGIYFCRLHAGDETQTKKLIWLR